MTELIWEGKYKDDKKVASLRVVLPFQTIETVNESAQERQRMLDLFSSGRDPEWRNRLIWGDKKYVLPSLLPEFASKVNLIYIDPPFDTGADFSFSATIPDHPATDEDETASFVKEPSIIEQKAYRDTWGKGLTSYLAWFYETVQLLQELLHESGSLFVHLDWHVSHYAKIILDEVLGPDNFRNEIILPGRAVKNLQQQFDAIYRLQVRHDVLLWYSKSQDTRYRQYWVKKHDAGNPEGHWHHFWSTADRPTMRYELFGTTPKSGQWVWKRERALQAIENYKKYLKEAGGRTLAQYWRDTGSTLEFIRPSPDDGKPQYWRAPAVMRLADTVWSGIPIYSNAHSYPTEKSEALLSEIIEMFSGEGDLILDCFVGSGTAAVVAEASGRRWIGCDLGRFAIHTTRKRLLSIQGVRPFVVQNLGKYERQAWQAAEFTSDESQAERELRYRRFILDLYKADPITGYTWLYGVKGGRMVHVGSVEAPVTLSDVKAIAAEVWRSVGKGKDATGKAAADILGWDFALEVNEVAKQVAAESKVDVAFKIIPREVLEKKAVEQGDIRFFELAALAVDVRKEGLKVAVTLSDFIIPPQDVPEDVQKAVKHWSQWVDYWAIDWDYKNDTFHNEWQSYRTRKDATIALEASHTYEQPGDYQVVVKVIDILGNDTTKLVTVKVSGAKTHKETIKASSRR